MSRGVVRLMLVRELREALRERSLVVYSLLIPLLLYPALMWLGLTGMMFVKGQTEGQRSRIEVVDLPDAHAELTALVSAKAETATKVEVERRTGAIDLDAAHAALVAGELDLLVEVQPQPDNFALALHYDGSRDRSNEARARFEDALASYRKTWLAREVAAAGVSEASWTVFEIEQVNEASGSEMGAFILGQLAPLTMLVMVALGAMYPAVDSTAGERERSTWETTLTLGVTRRQIVLAKYLYVATLASVAGLLNMAGISLALATLMTRFASGEIAITIPPTAIPIVLVGVLLIALLFAAAMMILAAFAKSFREGQSLVSPLFMVVLLPVMIADLPPEDITLGYAAAPIINVVIVFKQAITAELRWDFLAVTLASSLLAVGLCLALATRLLRNEELVAGSFQGSAKDFMRSLLRRPKPGARK